MDDEIKFVFELNFESKVYENQRLNGEDFIRVAVPLIYKYREGMLQSNIPDNQIDIRVKKIATYMVNYFNNKLDPKMDPTDVQNMIQLLSGTNPILNMFL